MLWPHGVLFRDSEQAIRKKVIETDIIEAIIGLGPNLFYNSPMESCIVVLNSSKPATRKRSILFVNGVELVTRERAHSRLSNSDLSKLCEAYFFPEKQAAITAMVDVDTIKDNSYNLSVLLYVSAKDDVHVPDIEQFIEERKASRKRLKKKIHRLHRNLADIGCVSDKVVGQK